MKGWNGQILRLDLSKGKSNIQCYDSSLALNFLGGRGFAIKILWDELRDGVDPLSPENKLVFACGPLTGLVLPCSGKLIVASKSPLTGGYGDGNIGSWAAVQLRKAGYDVLVLEGRAKKPSYLLIENKKVEILDARDFWGLTSNETIMEFKRKYGAEAGILTIGQAGEKLVKYATVISSGGRSGGRPGMGAVMGAKNVKAIIIMGSREISVDDSKGLKTLATEAFRSILKSPGYNFWRKQGTMAMIEWSQENSALPTYNFKEGVFDEAEKIDGNTMEALKIGQNGCPYCNMACGNIVKDSEGSLSEPDYENVAMLGSNIGLSDLQKIALLNRLADNYGIDTISLGNVIGFAIEASERKLINYDIDWGDFNGVKGLIEDIAFRRDLGNLLAEGTKNATEIIRGDSTRWAMHVKGLEISAYDCHVAPGMALAYGTSPIGAHHKDAWILGWEVSTDRGGYTETKVEKLIELQRIRGGMFECLGTCRFPWVELGFELERYPRFLKAATGIEMSLQDLYTIGDRVFNLIRAFWIKEYGTRWSKTLDYPPPRWFHETLTKGPFKGAILDMRKYEIMLQLYYKKRGWDQNGIPKEITLKKVGLEYVIQKLKKCYLK